MSLRPWVPKIDLSSSPTVFRYMQSKASVRFIVGPVGSGKTYATCFEIMAKAMQQEPNIEGYRPTRWAVIRNTMPDLKRTTMKTWLSAFPESRTGKMYKTSPIRHHILIAPQNWVFGKEHDQQPKEAIPGLDMEVFFFSMDKPSDVDALLSLEVTGIYFNEVREIPKILVNAATDRVGRFPSTAQGGVKPSWMGVMGDTNPYDEFHWLHKLEMGEEDEGEDLMEADTVAEISLDDMGVEFFRQPPGVYEAERLEDGSFQAIVNPSVTITDNSMVVRAAGKYWVANPDAENLKNLPVARPGESTTSKWGYYLHRVGTGNKELDWIQCYYEGKDTYVKEGKAVVSEFNPEHHVVDDLPILEGVPLEGGIDVGGGTLSPALIIGQRHPITGAYLIHHEFCPASMGVDRFATNVVRLINEWYGEDIELHKFGCDPAAKKREELYETVVMEALIDRGLPVVVAPTNAIDTRIAAIKSALGRWDFAKPLVMISRKGCPRLIKGLSGGWHYKQVNTSASKPKYREVPEKDEYSHPCDGLGYWFLSAGEGVNLTHKNRRLKESKTVIVETAFEPLDDFGF